MKPCVKDGTCVTACPSASIKQNLFEDEQIFSEIHGLLENVYKPEEEMEFEHA